MWRFSELGFSIGEEAVIEAPWGGTQSKPAGRHAYLAFNEKKYYVVNEDEQGLPINYKSVQKQLDEHADSTSCDKECL